MGSNLVSRSVVLVQSVENQPKQRNRAIFFIELRLKKSFNGLILQERFAMAPTKTRAKKFNKKPRKSLGKIDVALRNIKGTIMQTPYYEKSGFVLYNDD